MKPEQFEPFLRENKNRIYGYLLRFVENDEDAQDLLQDVCLAFYRRLELIESETAINYMYRMAHNIALNWLKRRKRTVLKPASDFDRLAGSSPKPDIHEIVNQAIARLPQKMAVIVHMYYHDKMSYKEISEQTGKSVKAVDSILNRSRAKLRKGIKVNEDGSLELTP